MVAPERDADAAAGAVIRDYRLTVLAALRDAVSHQIARGPRGAEQIGLYESLARELRMDLGPRPDSGDRDVRAAREYLDIIRSRPVATLPPTVLVRECAELRRLLGLVLEVLADFEDTALGDEVTQPTTWGGLHIAAPDVAAVMSALTDATQWQAQHGTAAAADLYRELMSRIGDQQ